MTGIRPRLWSEVARATVNGELLTVHARGPEEGAPVLLLHGIEGTWESWSALVGAVDLPYRWVSVSLPWRANNDYSWRRAASSADWIEEVLRVLPVAPRAAVGHSLGANSLLRWLSSGGSLPSVRAFGLLSPVYRQKSFVANWHAFYRTLSHFPVVLAEGILATLGPKAESIEPDILASMTEKMIQRIGPEAFLTVYENFVSSSEFDLKHVSTPTLILAGTLDSGIAGENAANTFIANTPDIVRNHDSGTFPENNPGIAGEQAVSALSADMPVADVRLLPGLNHFCHVQNPSEVAEHLRPFLDQHLSY